MAGRVRRLKVSGSGVRTACAALAALGVVAACVPHVPLADFRGSLAANEELVTVESRKGVTTRVLVTKPASAPKGLFLYFPGGEGFLVNASDGVYGAFRRELAGTGYVVGVVDVPSDQSRGLEGLNGYLELFRVSADHTRDGRAVLDALHLRWPMPVYLMGHSMGAISAAHLAASLGDRRLAGLVLLGSPTERGPQASWVSVPSANLHRITVPVVLAHHRDDGCRGSTFASASRYPKLFSASPRVGFIEVIGGPPPQSPNPCVGGNYHSFAGIRRQVMDAVVRWLGGEDVRRVGD